MALLGVTVPAVSGRLFRLIAQLTTGLTLVASLVLFAALDRTQSGVQFASAYPWLGDNLKFTLGLDGVSALGFVLAALVGFAGTLLGRDVQAREKEFHLLYLVLVGGALGAFVVRNLFFFYFFMEFEVLVAYVLIAGWGRAGQPDDTVQRERAALQLSLFASAGALLALLGIIALFSFAPGALALDRPASALQQTPLPATAASWIVLLLTLGLGVLLSAWPLHVWAPPAYAAAPTSIAMFSAGVLKQLAAYGLLRFVLPLLPAASVPPWSRVLAAVAVMNILYIGWITLRQADGKKLIAWASVSHAGYLLLGLAALNSIGAQGVALMIFASGVSAALLFGVWGLLEAQTNRRELADYGGLARRAPFLGVAFTMAVLAAIGLPGFANFVSEILVLFGAWLHGALWMRLAVAAGVWGLVLTATYFLRAVRTVCFGPVAGATEQVAAPHAAEKFAMVLLLVSLLAIGIWPRLATDLTKQSFPALGKPATAHFQTLEKSPQSFAAPTKSGCSCGVGAAKPCRDDGQSETMGTR
jgi:NADH-quinone oxidoreductase subunit M